MSDSSMSKRAPSSVLGKRAYSLINEVTSDISSMSSRTESSGPKTPTPWLPPLSSLLINNYPISSAKLHVAAETTPPSTIPQPAANNKRKTHPQVFMPMIPYYFHHKDFGIESCMLQLEGQKNFNKYYYI
ncbi:hypothetical protein INT47_000719 [Mucor saturninus]|uniref:Uncharacterized protein n=1 Tax=Mucor saturninus TaxID=64648 RepID=A0A8H7RM64_9FUNG|nr:hypothetical protein INT47_000719 [Mucor saturninus]